MAYKSGEKLCGCTLLEKCGEGAYGEVWLAEDVLGGRVAVKIIGDRGRYSERELAGLRNYRDCNHPNLLKIRYVEITETHIACVMDAADDLNGGKGPYLADTLAHRLEKSGRLEGKEILAMLEGLLAGLEELHRRGLVHRDIKPDNILWVNGRPTLADAGLIAEEGKGSLVGTPGFMSPKLLSGQGAAEASDDFYALGKVVYCALTGRPVGDYPSLPENMTISVDASLGRAFREACKRPVRTSAEFRTLLSDAARPDRRLRALPPKMWFFAGAAALLLLIAALLLHTPLFLEKDGGPEEGENFFSREKKVSPSPGTTDVSRKPRLPENPETPRPAAGPEVPRATDRRQAKVQKMKPEETDRAKARKARYLKAMRSEAAALLRQKGLLPGDEKFASRLLTCETVSKREILRLLLHGARELRPKAAIRPGAPGVSGPARELYGMFMVVYPDFESRSVRGRQGFWRSRPGDAAEIRREMLETDHLMQALALDLLLREKANAVLEAGRFRPGDKTELGELFRLREGLLNPEPAGFPRYLFAESAQKL